MTCQQLSQGKARTVIVIDILVCLLVCVFSCICCVNGATLFQVCPIIVFFLIRVVSFHDAIPIRALHAINLELIKLLIINIMHENWHVQSAMTSCMNFNYIS